MKKIVAIVIAVVLMTITAACIAEHMVKVEYKYHYSYGDVPEFDCVMMTVQVEETVYNLNGDEISNCEYEIFKAPKELPWYNVWSENVIEFR